MTKTALILGASGGIGGETARALVRHGWTVRGLVRRIRPELDPTIQWIAGDAMDGGAVRQAAEGVQAIVHAVNPPGYRDWDKLVLPMLDNSIAAARATGARLALPGTIYNYDPREVRDAGESAPQNPSTRKGAIRAAMEQRLETVSSLVLRAGDYFGPQPGNSWLSQGMVTPGKPVTATLYPGSKGVGHNWAYLPDVGETFARLLDRMDELPDQARFHFEGYWDADGTGFTRALGEAAGRARLKVRRLPWSLLPLAAPFSATLREMIEMRIFWQHPLRLNNRALVAFLGGEPRTPLVAALRTSLAALGCR